MSICQGCESGISGKKNEVMWCNDCRKSKSCEPFIDIPLIPFIEEIQCHLTMSDIISLSEVSKEMNSYFNENEIWKEFYPVSTRRICHK